MKGRVVSDGWAQRKKYEKSQTSSDTCHKDSLMMILFIDAMERWIIGTGNFLSAYLKATMRYYTLIKFEGESIDILCQTNPDYETYIIYEKGGETLYLILIK